MGDVAYFYKTDGNNGTGYVRKYLITSSGIQQSDEKPIAVIQNNNGQYQTILLREIPQGDLQRMPFDIYGTILRPDLNGNYRQVYFDESNGTFSSQNTGGSSQSRKVSFNTPNISGLRKEYANESGQIVLRYVSETNGGTVIRIPVGNISDGKVNLYVNPSSELLQSDKMFNGWGQDYPFYINGQQYVADSNGNITPYSPPTDPGGGNTDPGGGTVDPGGGTIDPGGGGTVDPGGGGTVNPGGGGTVPPGGGGTVVNGQGIPGYDPSILLQTGQSGYQMPSGNSPITQSDVNRYFMSSWLAADKANKERWNTAYKGAAQTWANVQNYLQNVGKQERSDIQESYSDAGKAIQQDMTSRGLTGTTVLPTMQTGNVREMNKSLGRLNDRLTEQNLAYQNQMWGNMYNVLQSRNDQYPDLTQYLLLSRGTV